VVTPVIDPRAFKSAFGCRAQCARVRQHKWKWRTEARHPAWRI